jgi:hypothetical protein
MSEVTYQELLKYMEEDRVNAPRHYTYMDPVYEPINVIEEWGLGYHLGNVIKYIVRAGRKEPEKEKEDLEKAVWYLQRYITNIE